MSNKHTDLINRLHNVLGVKAEYVDLVHEAADALQAESAAVPEDELVWAVSKWHDEVANRPLINVHRRSLDDTWRQVIRHFGGDPDKLVGPSHSDLLAAAQQPPATSAKPLPLQQIAGEREVLIATQRSCVAELRAHGRLVDDEGLVTDQLARAADMLAAVPCNGPTCEGCRHAGCCAL